MDDDPYGAAAAAILLRSEPKKKAPPPPPASPGIEDVTVVSLAGLSADFWRQCQTNQAGFPQGVDMVLTCGEWAIGLPRSTQVQPALER